MVDDELIGTVIDVAAHIPAKLRALRAHATQVSVWESGERQVYALSNDLAAPVLPHEYFVLASGSPAGRRAGPVREGLTRCAEPPTG